MRASLFYVIVVVIKFNFHVFNIAVEPRSFIVRRGIYCRMDSKHSLKWLQEVRRNLVSFSPAIRGINGTKPPAEQTWGPAWSDENQHKVQMMRQNDFMGLPVFGTL